MVKTLPAKSVNADVTRIFLVSQPCPDPLIATIVQSGVINSVCSQYISHILSIQFVPIPETNTGEAVVGVSVQPGSCKH